MKENEGNLVGTSPTLGEAVDSESKKKTDVATGIEPIDSMSPGDSEPEVVTIKFDTTGEFKLPVRTVQMGGTCKSVSKVMPVGKSVLIAEVGEISMLKLLHMNKSNGQGVNVMAKYIIVGTGNEVPYNFPLGIIFYPKTKETFNMRGVFDPQNHYSFDALINKGEKDKELLAAISIVGNKDKSRVGLRIDDTNPSPEVLEEINKYKGNKSVGDSIYRDKILPFINYKLIDYTNIDAIVI